MQKPVWNRWRPLVLAPLLLLMVGLVAACEEDSAGPESGATTEEVANENVVIDPFLGNTVTVSGEVTSIVSPQAFRIGGDDWGGEPLRVINANNANVSEGQVVQVTGTVRAFDETTLEQDLGLTFDDNLYDGWDDDHVLVASQVKPTPGSAG